MDFDEAIKYVAANSSFKSKEDMLAYARCMAVNMRWENYQEMIDLWKALCKGSSYIENVSDSRIGCLFQIHPTIQMLMISYALSIQCDHTGKVIGRKVGREAQAAHYVALAAADTILVSPYVVWNRIGVK